MLVDFRPTGKRRGSKPVDVKTEQVESADTAAQRIRKAWDTFPADKLIINLNCGLGHPPPDVARSKLAAMVEGKELRWSAVPCPRNIPSHLLKNQ